jgi:hypothetical protein
LRRRELLVHDALSRWRWYRHIFNLDGHCAFA